ncbi:MAG: metallophosphoesterase family protein [Clostridia bacterium]|nr:metallophosphoesterase family protein [Clostridia bacterium]
MKKIISIMLCVLMAFSFSVIAFAENEKLPLQFGEDGKFKIMQVNDTQDTNNINKKTVEFLKAALQSEEPDLVVIVGDMLSDSFTFPTKERLSDGLRVLAEIFNDAKVPFAVTYGNHDHQHEDILSIEEMNAVFEEFEYFCNAQGCDPGTFNLPVLSSDGTHYPLNIYMMDTHNKSEKIGGYEGVYPEQVEWYKNTSDALKVQNNGEVVPSLLFQHIPVKEMHQFYQDGEKGAADSFFNINDGNWYALNDKVAVSEENFVGEPPYSEPKSHTTGQYEAWLEKGDIIGAFFGHDHINNFVGVTDEGITLGYNGGSGFAAYGSGDKRSVRIFEIDENDVENYTTRSVFYGKLTGDEFDFYPSDLLSADSITKLLRIFYTIFFFLK